MRRMLRLTGRPGDAERDVTDEFRFHVEMRARELMAAGMGREEAFAAARAAFGDMEALARESIDVRASRDRDRRMRHRLHGFMQDVRFALRTLRKNPGFALSALTTLALGIGATTAVFTVLNGVLLRPLPYPNHERLVSVWTTAMIGGARQAELPFSAANFADLRDRTRGAFEELAALRAWGLVLGEAGRSELLPGALVTGGFFRALGVSPLLGRALGEADVAPGAPKVVVIGHDLWRRRFAADPAVLGSTLLLNGTPHTVVGVMPPGFSFPRGTELPAGFQFPLRTEAWAAYELTPENLKSRGTFNLAVVGVMRRDVGRERATREVNASMRAIGDANGLASISLGAALVPMRDQSVAGVRRGLVLIFGAVALVLVVACANVSNLLLAHTSGRQQELAIRAAIGAGRWRIMRQLVTENLLLAIAGGALGIALAVLGKQWLLSLVPPSLPRLDDVAIDATVLATAIGVALLAGLAFGILAAVHATRGDAALTLRASAGTSSSGPSTRFRQGLIVAEIAVSLVLLAGAAALTESFLRIQRVHPGFEPRDAITAQVLVPGTGTLSFREQQPRWARTFGAYLERARSIPGVVAAGAVSSLPLSGAWESSSYTVEGREALPAGARPEAHYAVASPEYFRAMGIALREGRDFGPVDTDSSPRVVIVSRALADATWPGERVVGKRLRLFDDRPLEVIGVVDDVRQTALTDEAVPTLYLPLSQFAYPAMTVVVRTAIDPSAIVPALRRELAVVDPLLPLEDVRPLTAVLDASLAARRFGMLLLGFFAASALGLVVVGLYGVIAFSVARRTREIGVRMALGAGRREVFRLVLGEGARMTAVGILIGLAGAVGLSRLLARTIEGVRVIDPLMLGGVTLLLVVVALLASGLPARRAMGVEPVEAIRGE